MSVSAVNSAISPPATNSVERVERGPDHDGDKDDGGVTAPNAQTATIPNKGVLVDAKM